ncbi:MAG: copper resistance protein CopC [Actinomycetales bacterium]|nr:copper resistance protein CopC [Actinomycetales bacterium]
MIRGVLAGAGALALALAGASIAAPAALGASALHDLPAAAGLPATAGAAAHSVLVSSDPAAGSTVTAAQPMSVTMNETLLDVTGQGNGFALQVVDAAGAFYGDGCLEVDGASLRTASPVTLGGAGDYTLRYQVVSADGHTVSGEIPFGYAPAAGAASATGAAAAPACGVEDANPTPGATDAVPPGGGDAATGGGAGDDVVWIVVAVLAVLIAAGVTAAVLVAARRRPE